MEDLEEVKADILEANKLFYKSFRSLDVICTGYKDLNRDDLFTLSEILPDGVHKSTLKTFYSSKYGGEVNESMPN